MKSKTQLLFAVAVFMFACMGMSRSAHAQNAATCAPISTANGEYTIQCEATGDFPGGLSNGYAYAVTVAGGPAVLCQGGVEFDPPIALSGRYTLLGCTTPPVHSGMPYVFSGIDELVDATPEDNGQLWIVRGVVP